MAFLGLVPSEYSSGPSVRRRGITKAGNPHARRLLAEAAWAYQGVPRIGRQMRYRQEALPKAICDIVGATAPDVALPQAGGPRQGEAEGRHRRRPGGVPAGRVATAAIRSVRSAASRARGRILGVVRDLSTTETSVPRARQLRDEPQSGRYPIRGYQQRQPSLTRGAADQTDLKNPAPGTRGRHTELMNDEAGVLCPLDGRQPYQRNGVQPRAVRAGGFDFAGRCRRLVGCSALLGCALLTSG